MGIGMDHWEWEGLGLKKTFPLISALPVSAGRGENAAAGWRLWPTGTVWDGGCAVSTRRRDVHGLLHGGAEKTACTHDGQRITACQQSKENDEAISVNADDSYNCWNCRVNDYISATCELFPFQTLVDVCSNCSFATYILINRRFHSLFVCCVYTLLAPPNEGRQCRAHSGWQILLLTQCAFVQHRRQWRHQLQVQQR